MDDKKLIDFVRNYPFLYDKRHTDFKDRDKKMHAWMEIANSLGVNRDTAIKRWGNLRERFSKEIRSPRGASGGRPWPLLASLQFLRGHIIPRPMRQSAPMLDSSVEDYVSSDMINLLCDSNTPAPVLHALTPSMSPDDSASISSDQSASSTSRGKRRRSTEVDALDTTILEAVKTFQELCERKARREEISAEISGFRTMICSAISKMSIPTQAKVMRRCTDIVMQAQIDEHEGIIERLD